MTRGMLPVPMLVLLGSQGRIIQCHPEPEGPMGHLEHLADHFFMPDQSLPGILTTLLRKGPRASEPLERIMEDGSRCPGQLYAYRWQEPGTDVRFLVTWYPDASPGLAASAEGFRRFLLQVRQLLERARSCAEDVKQGRGQIDMLMMFLERAMGLLGAVGGEDNLLVGHSASESPAAY